MTGMTNCGYGSQNLAVALNAACRDMFAAFLEDNGLAEWRLIITAQEESILVYSESPTGDIRRSEFPRTDALPMSIRLMLDQHYQAYLAGAPH